MRPPLTDAQVHRHHRTRFGWAVASLVASLVSCALLALGAAESREPVDVGGWVAVGVLAVGIAYLTKVARRRWNRLHDAR